MRINNDTTETTPFSEWIKTQLTNRKPRDFTLMFGGIGSLLLLTTLQNQDIQFDQNTSSLKKPVTNQFSHNPFGGIETSEWCVEPAEPPIPYDRCKFDSIMFRFGVYGGLTNALHFILKGSIWAMQEDVCFYVTENGKDICLMHERIDTYCGFFSVASV